jgi:hypothetical protein
MLRTRNSIQVMAIKRKKKCLMKILTSGINPKVAPI